ncbi:helix-turn-helix domain-containing protein [Microbacterium sp. H1-D42]|uniref:GbsR/MarR family transcriptional regulator n=1 Tax=Microbacterium sp. H1-D42 TaxID=2925844 RepID=UPI001F52CE64|nr:helix-turn-helix domain-containing protein [Microbacterium sp. H1-D42]UNK71334.1 MarR family transcriptional regulator [Microbacterium sp. H1-D42]
MTDADDAAPPAGDATHLGVDAAEDAAAVITAVGFPRMPARVLMALIAAPAGGYTAAELGERLGVSAAAVSGAVRYLQTVHMIHRISRPDRRLVTYEIIGDAWYGAMSTNSPVYDRLAALIEDIGAAHEDDHAARARSEEMAEFFRFMSRRMPQLIDEWETLRAERLLSD